MRSQRVSVNSTSDEESRWMTGALEDGGWVRSRRTQ